MQLQKLILEIPTTADFKLHIYRTGKRFSVRLQLLFGKDSFIADASSENLNSAVELLTNRLLEKHAFINKIEER